MGNFFAARYVKSETMIQMTLARLHIYDFTYVTVFQANIFEKLCFMNSLPSVGIFLFVQYTIILLYFIDEMMVLSERRCCIIDRLSH